LPKEPYMHVPIRCW